MSGVHHVNIRWCVMCNVSQLFSFFCNFQSLQNSQGQQREFGDGQRDRKKNSSPSASDEDNVILNSIKNRGIHGQEFHPLSSSSLAFRIIRLLGLKRTEGPAAQIMHSRLSHQMLLISHWFSKPVISFIFVVLFFRRRGEFASAECCNHQCRMARRLHARSVLPGTVCLGILLSLQSFSLRLQRAQTASRGHQCTKTKGRASNYSGGTNWD